VKFLIEGKSSPDFKGNFRFNTEFPRSTQLISNKAEPVGTVNSKDAADKKDDSASGDKDTADVSNETETRVSKREPKHRMMKKFLLMIP